MSTPSGTEASPQLQEAETEDQGTSAASEGAALRPALHGRGEGDEVQVDSVHVPLSDDEEGENHGELAQLAAAFASPGDE